MSRAVRAADISSCIDFFTAIGEPCGKIGRATAVLCGVCLNGCRGACWGLGTCLVWLVRCVVGLCTVCCTAIGCLLRCLFVAIGKFFVVLLVVGLIAVVVMLGYLSWDSSVHFFDTARNLTAAFYDKTIKDLSGVVQLWDKTEVYYDGAKGKIDELVNHPEVQRVVDKTVDWYDAAKDHVVDSYEQVQKHESVQSAVSATMSFFNILKSKINQFL